MSIEAAKLFLERMKTDEKFATKIAAESTEEARMALAQTEGFIFTAADMEQVVGEDLSDDELDAVAGGAVNSIQAPGLPRNAN
ncbi:MAG: protein of unknown function nitrogen fixation [Firmicutes bacterium]|nr:protein of unknown function nitrogen fixation [Bacillota bacterium]